MSIKPNEDKLSFTLDVATYESPTRQRRVSSEQHTETVDVKSSKLLRTIVAGFTFAFVSVSVTILMLVFLGYGSVGDKYNYKCVNFQNHACKVWEMQDKNGKDLVTSTEETFIKYITDMASGDITPKDDRLQTKMKLLYQTCMNLTAIEQKGVSPINNVIKDWPLISANDWSGNMSDAFHTVAVNSRLIPFNGIFSIRVGPDFTSRRSSVIWLSLSGNTEPGVIQLPGNRSEYQQARNKYVMLALKLLEQLSERKQITSKMASQINTVIDLEDAISEFQNRFKPERMEESTIGKFSKESHVRWLDIIKTTFGHPVSIHSKIIIIDKLNLLKLLRTIKNSPYGPTGVVHLSSWSVIVQLLPHLDTRCREIYDEIQIVRSVMGLPVQPFPEPIRELFCVDVLMEFVPWIVVRHLFNDDNLTMLIEEGKSVVSNVEKSLLQSADNKTWIPYDTKKFIHHKFERMSIIVGFPSWLPVVKNYREFYKKIPIIGDYFIDILAILGWYRQKQWQQFSAKAAYEDLFISGLAKPSVQYSKFTNTLMISPATLMQPIFTSSSSVPIQYGILGTMVAHELIHVLHDSTGGSKSYKASANVLQRERIVNNEDTEADRGLKCLTNQYKAYCPIVDPEAMTPICVDGERTLNENVADNGAVRHAFMAMQTNSQNCSKCSRKVAEPGFENYSDDEMFFYAYSRMFCPGNSENEMEVMLTRSYYSPPEYRAVGSLSNFDQFSKTFHCTDNDFLNSDSRCIIW